ncbi:lytic transglycosylase domain-containing protein [Rhodococcus sp. 1168]|uniref:lytic transglycosylase domain-containing protein n=1 Tax=Rhodococcus sp. 1168 TaxID=2018041 RepID=UPI000A0D4448|nr:lytic murein transglycosylase [Rhodococcus sp. 1168]ORI21689.1 murein transglycosylase [Rhodococcus sp. 1168]
MGRHRRASNSTMRRNSVIALTGLVPAGLITAASSAGAAEYLPFMASESTTEQSEPVVETSRPLASETDAQPVAAAEAPVALAVAAAPQPAVAPTPELPTSLMASPIAIPTVNVSAYKNAEQILTAELPGCGISWTVIAGIGRVESTHANNGKADDAGELFEPILGPRLDGSLAGNNVIADTDGGALDGDPHFDRAVGPMQFLPETWNHYHADGNGDGISDPQNLYDAALATGKYLCDGGLDLRDLGQTTKAILRYNNSMAYVANVLAWSTGYATGIVPTSDELPRIH